VVPTKYLVGTTLATNGNARVTRKGSPNYPVDFKRQLAALACEPGISVAKLALEHGLNANLLFKWRRHYRAGLFGSPQPEHVAAAPRGGIMAPKLLPVVTLSSTARQDAEGVKQSPALEIVVGGAVVRVIGEVSRKVLRTVLDCLAERA